MSEVFDRLVKFGREPDRKIFCQRLESLWQEQGIFCQTYPTITNQILDLYKLYHLVQEKQGYLEVTTNRGWKEISNILGFGDSGSAAYSVKRNYVRLGLLAYECRFDRAGIDPRSVIELSEMPHTVKKRKRANRTMGKITKQQIQIDESDEIKAPSPIETPKSPYCSRIVPQPISIDDLHNLSFILRAGSLADSNRYLDAILINLSDSRASSFFNLKYLPGLFNALIEQYLACLYEIYGQSFLPDSSSNDYYLDWFLQSKFRINDIAIGPDSSDRYHSIMSRCLCLTTILRNLSFLDENDFLASDRCLIEILERILNCHHQTMHDQCDYERSKDFIQSFTQPSRDMQMIGCLSDDEQKYLTYLLDNTFITLANLSVFIELRHCYSLTRTRLIQTIAHWIVCSLPLANEQFISMTMEEISKEVFISPRQICLQIFAKLCTNEINVDWIFVDLNFEQLIVLCETLLSLMNTSNQEDIDREYSLRIICSLCQRNRSLVEFFASKSLCLELIINYLEMYEYCQQQYLIATLTSCYNASTMPINYSSDMMIDSCIQLLLLFASVQEENCLKLFEYKLVDMSSSIYFERKILKSFAEILFLLRPERWKVVLFS